MRVLTLLGIATLSLTAAAHAGDDPSIPSEHKTLVVSGSSNSGRRSVLHLRSARWAQSQSRRGEATHDGADIRLWAEEGRFYALAANSSP